MIVLGKNSSVYKIIKSVLPTHNAISHREVSSLDICDELILVLSHPKNKASYESHLKNLKELAQRNQLLLISTSGLNGIQNRVRNKYFYLKSKREVEKLVLRANGKVLRCGAFSPPESARGIWFVTNKNDFIDIDYSKLMSISYLGRPLRFGSLNLIEKLVAWILSKIFFIPKFEFIFIFFHILMFWTPNRGYTLLSNQVFSTRCSVGAGLSSLASRRLGYKFHIVPKNTDIKDDISKPWCQSFNRNGFGSRWHGVGPEDVKNLDSSINLLRIKIPLVPKGAFRLNILAKFWRYFYLKVISGVERSGFVEISGLDVDGFEDVLACENVVLNAGVVESLSILSNIHKISFDGVLGYHVLSSIFPARAKWNLIEGVSFFSHIKNALVLHSKQSSFLVIGRPPMSIAHETDIIFGSNYERISYLLRNFDKKIFKWLLYSKFGVKLFDNSCIQLDLQISRSLKCRFDRGSVHYDETDTSENYEKDLISSIKVSEFIELDGDFEWTRRELNALHAHFNSLDLTFEEFGNKATVKGKIYLGSAGQLLNLISPVHTSHYLLEPRLYRIKLT